MIAYDLNHYGLDDSEIRISVQEGTAFSLGWAVRTAQVPSLGGGNLKLSKAQKNARTLPLSFMIYGDSDLQLDARLGALLNLLDQPRIVLGRSVDGVRTEAEVELMSVQDQADYDAGSHTVKTGSVVSLNDIYWRDATYTTVPLVAGSNDLGDLAVSTAPIIDSKVLVAGAATPLTALSVQDDNSGSGLQWNSTNPQPGTPLRTYPISSGALGLAVDSVRNAYVAFADGTIKKYDVDGNIAHTWSSTGAYGVAIDSAAANIYFTHSPFGADANKISRIVVATGVQTDWSFASGSIFAGIGVDSAGVIYAADAAHLLVRKISSAGSETANWSVGSGILYGLDIDPAGAVYVSSLALTGTNPAITIFKTTTTGTAISSWAAGTSKLANSSGGNLGVGGDGNVYFLNPTRGTITKFSNAGATLAVFGSLGSGTGQISGPIGIDVSDSNDVFVADTGNRRMTKFDGDGVTTVAGSQWLLIDVSARSAKIVSSASFDADGDDVSSGLSTVPWAGKKLRLSPSPAFSDLLDRDLNVTVAQSGGSTALLRAKNAFL